MYIFAAKLVIENYFVKLKIFRISKQIFNWNFGC